MSVGDQVSVFDVARDRWRRAEVVSVARLSAIVQLADGWWAVPLLPAWIRPVAVVRAA